MMALGGMGVEVEGYVALGDHKINNGRAQELQEARIMEKWEILRNVLRKKKVTPRDSLRELKNKILYEIKLFIEL